MIVVIVRTRVTFEIQDDKKSRMISSNKAILWVDPVQPCSREGCGFEQLAGRAGASWETGFSKSVYISMNHGDIIYIYIYYTHTHTCPKVHHVTNSLGFIIRVCLGLVERLYIYIYTYIHIFMDTMGYLLFIMASKVGYNEHD